MRRRTVLCGLAGTVAVGCLGVGNTREGGYEPLGSIEIEGTRDGAVHHDGQVAYVAARDGFVSVDISDPEQPERLTVRRDIDTEGNGPFEDVWDLWPAGDRLAVVGPATNNPDAAHGFALFDISDPDSPEQVAFHATDHHIHNSYFEDNIVYLTGSGLDPEPLVMVDVSGDDSEEVGRWSLVEHDPAWADIPRFYRPLHDVYVQDGIAYCSYWDAGAWIVDVSDPENVNVHSNVGGYTPEEIQEFEGSQALVGYLIPPGNAHYCQVDEDGNVLAVGAEAWAIDLGDGETVGGPGGVDLYDVTDSTDPAHLATIEAPASFDQTPEGWFTTAHNLDIVGSRLYSSWYFGGVKIHDISDPGTPQELAWWRDPTETAFWTAQSAIPEETFIATSAAGIGEELGVEGEISETQAGLYVFPDRAGEQHDPPDLSEEPNETGQPDDGTTPQTPTETPAVTETPTPTAVPADDGRTAPPPEDGQTDADDDGTGFGPLSVVTSIGGLSYLLARRQRDT